nr:hypothetical protein [Nostoc sp. ChiQUE02]
MHTETSLSGGFCFWRSPPQQKVEPVRFCRTISDRSQTARTSVTFQDRHQNFPVNTHKSLVFSTVYSESQESGVGR